MSYVNSAAVTAIVSLAATLLLAGAVITDAQAGDGGRQKAHSKQGAGGSRTHTTTVQHTGSGHTRNTIATRDDGKTATRNTTVANDRAAGTRSVDATATGFNGRTTSYSSDAQRTERRLRARCHSNLARRPGEPAQHRCLVRPCVTQLHQDGHRSERRLILPGGTTASPRHVTCRAPGAETFAAAAGVQPARGLRNR